MIKESLFERIVKKIHREMYFLTHKEFVDCYNKRFSSDFSQEDLEYCIRNLYQLRMHKKLDLSNPQTFNEKLNWLKCFYHDDRMTECADKVSAPTYFLNQTGLNESYIVKNLGVYDDANEIDFKSLPDRFVLKSNWGSGCQIIVTNKNDINIEKVILECNKWNEITYNHYYDGFEYGYKNIKPKIVCEEFVDFLYKIEFFCFNGKPLYFWTVFNDKTSEVCADFYDANTLNRIKLKHGYPNSKQTISISDDYKKMFDIATVLSEKFPFVRVDFFKTQDGFKFSEMTFYHWNAMMPFKPSLMDLEFGKKLILPNKKV